MGSRSLRTLVHPFAERRIAPEPMGRDRWAVAPRASAKTVVSLDGLARAATQPAVLAAIWLAVILHLVAVAAKLPAGFQRPDFSHYYASARAAREGLNPYTLDLKRYAAQFGLDVGRTIRATQTPSFILCFEPLTLLPPRAAYAVWSGANVLFLAVALVLLIGRAPGLDSRVQWALAAFALLYPPLEVHFQYAQSQILVLMLLVLMMRALEHGKQARAGLVLALAGLLRGFPLLMAGYLAVGRRWRALGYTAGGLAAGGLITAFAFGPARIVSFRQAIELVTSGQFIAAPANIALGSFVSRVLWYVWAAGLGKGFFALRLPFAILAQIALLALTMMATLAPCGVADRDGRAFALWVCATTLLAPTAWLHYMVLLLIPFVLMAAAGARGTLQARSAWAAVASYLTIALAMIVASALPARAPAWIKLMVEEFASVSALTAYLAAYWFAVGDGFERRA